MFWRCQILTPESFDTGNPLDHKLFKPHIFQSRYYARSCILHHFTSFQQSLGHPTRLILMKGPDLRFKKLQSKMGLRLLPPKQAVGALRAFVGLTSLRTLYADFEYFEPSSSQEHPISKYIKVSCQTLTRTKLSFRFKPSLGHRPQANSYVEELWEIKSRSILIREF